MSTMLCPVCGPAAPNLGVEIIGKRAQKTVVLAYADDVTIFMTPTDLPVIRIDIQCYEKSTGESLNAKKSKALAVGGWSTTTDTLDIPYHTEVNILGVTFTRTIEQSMNKTWANVTGRVIAQARDTYGRDICLSQSMRYVQT